MCLTKFFRIKCRSSLFHPTHLKTQAEAKSVNKQVAIKNTNEIITLMVAYESYVLLKPIQRVIVTKDCNLKEETL